MMLTVLSVDWDYFFRCPSWFDWSHNEEQPFFYEMVWSTRASSRHIKTGERAIDAFVPDRKLMDGFWDRVLAPGYRWFQAFVCESHKSLGEILLGHPGVAYRIWNFDQHHDLGYDKRPTMDCGNWAYHVLRQRKRSQYRVIYPPWRAEDPEKNIRNDMKVKTCEPPTGLRPDVVFVCRSSCWTPSWADDAWLEFLAPLKKMCREEVWNSMPFVDRARDPNREEALKLAEEFERFKKEAMQR